MKQLTLRGFDEGLKHRLEELAQTHSISLNRAALILMRRGQVWLPTTTIPK